MKKSKIISILNMHEKGRPVAEICCEYGMSQPTFYQWKSKYVGKEQIIVIKHFLRDYITVKLKQIKQKNILK